MSDAVYRRKRLDDGRVLERVKTVGYFRRGVRRTRFLLVRSKRTTCNVDVCCKKTHTDRSRQRVERVSFMRSVDFILFLRFFAVSPRAPVLMIGFVFPGSRVKTARGRVGRKHLNVSRIKVKNRTCNATIVGLYVRRDYINTEKHRWRFVFGLGENDDRI